LHNEVISINYSLTPIVQQLGQTAAVLWIVSGLKENGCQYLTPSGLALLSNFASEALLF